MWLQYKAQLLDIPTQLSVHRWCFQEVMVLLVIAQFMQKMHVEQFPVTQYILYLEGDIHAKI